MRIFCVKLECFNTNASSCPSGNDDTMIITIVSYTYKRKLVRIDYVSHSLFSVMAEELSKDDKKSDHTVLRKINQPDFILDDDDMLITLSV